MAGDAAADLSALVTSLRGARDALRASADVLDALNVFPVPDGDTGRNMLHTVQGGVDSLDERPPASLEEACERLGARFSRDSRGNSGFLLSAFFDAFLGAVAAAGRLDAASFRRGFDAGATAARKALSRPREGTLLTASDTMAAMLRGAPQAGLEDTLAEAVTAGAEAVESTPALLPLLRRAGVVDAGALGFVHLFAGMQAALAGEALPPLEEATYRFPPSDEPEDPEETLDRPFCTQLLVELEPGTDLGPLKHWLERRCDSIVLHERREWLRVHVHSEVPQEVAAEAARVGTVVESRVEDMREQIAAREVAAASTGRAAVLAAVPGTGFAELFESLGASSCLEYERDLPSVQQLVDAIQEVGVEALLLLPNDGNLVAAAGRAAELARGCSVQVVPTVDPVRGIAAMYGFDAQAPLTDAGRSMAESSELAVALAVHRSVRDQVFGGATIARDQLFVLRGHDLLAVGADLEGTIAAAIDSQASTDLGAISLYRGRALPAEELALLVPALEGRFDGVEIQSFDGLQAEPLLWLALE